MTHLVDVVLLTLGFSILTVSIDSARISTILKYIGGIGLVVVAVSGISYISYLLQHVWVGDGATSPDDPVVWTEPDTLTAGEARGAVLAQMGRELVLVLPQRVVGESQPVHKGHREWDILFQFLVRIRHDQSFPSLSDRQGPIPPA